MAKDDALQGAEKVKLSAPECVTVVVISTPAGQASSSAQQLHELGVVDANQIAAEELG
jgi:hypothetical protein